MPTPTFQNAFENLQQRQSQLPPINRQGVSIVPAMIEGRISATTKALTTEQFPSDLPPHHFTIVEGELVNGAGVNPADTVGLGRLGIGNFSKAYRLPVPIRMVDAHSIVYNENFNLLNVAKDIGGVISGALPKRITDMLPAGAIAGVARDIASAKGYSLNTFKVVTLSAPEFRTFSLDWNLKPKSYDESAAIQRVITGLKQAMHPTMSNFAVFEFPRVFVLFFNTGSRFLYKFKPCVLRSCAVSYTGSNPQAAFYNNELGEAIPEGVTITTEWLELEIWLRKNFESDTENGLPTNNPFAAVDSLITN